ncbi:MAG: hypothetical protein RBG13Loki_0918 [Promethearchaeota archaeon CR_4]|nr:MAG: hypothetical protein RBG13Loki_0918 [Candidatus Lokiarchaeota archaeon CR_4]
MYHIRNTCPLYCVLVVKLWDKNTATFEELSVRSDVVMNEALVTLSPWGMSTCPIVFCQ